MKIAELADRVERLDPHASPRDIARVCLLLTNFTDQLDRYHGDAELLEAWKDVSLKLQLATDQHAATTEELDELAASDPKEFHPDQIWVLLRAIKVQGQVLQLYVGGEAIDV
jgi:hypothetical protein